MPTNLQPLSETSAVILSTTGSTDDVASAVLLGCIQILVNLSLVLLNK